MPCQAFPPGRAIGGTSNHMIFPITILLAIWSLGFCACYKHNFAAEYTIGSVIILAVLYLLFLGTDNKRK